MVKRDETELDNDGQKTHYWIKGKKRARRGFLKTLDGLLGSGTKQSSPFVRLFNGRETDSAVAARYSLYQELWMSQEAMAHKILNKTNVTMFENLLQFLRAEYKKLPVGLLLLTSNSANNTRILQELYRYIERYGKDVKIAALNSKNCANIKSMLREVVKQFLSFSNISNEDRDEELDDEYEDNEGRVSYDFDLVEDWFNSQRRPDMKLVILLEDTDSMDSLVLNQLIRLLYSYFKKLPLKIVMGLSSENASNWVNSNLSNDVRILIDGYKFKSNNNKSLAYTIMNELFLNVNTPLLLDSVLSSILLTRYENSNNSIDILLSEIKLSYMIHFYGSPLPILLQKEFKITKPYIDALRMLPSFKSHIEMKVHDLRELKENFQKSEAIPESQMPNSKTQHKLKIEIDFLKNDIQELLNSDDALIHLFRSSRIQFLSYKLSVFNAVNVIHTLQPEKSTFEIYKLIVNAQLFNSLHLSRFFKHLQTSPETFKRIEKLRASENLVESLDGVNDDNLIELNNDLRLLTSDNYSSKLINAVQRFLNNPQLARPINLLLFSEIYTIDGGSLEFSTAKSIEENKENLMINLIRPNLRSILEAALEDSDSYLKNELILKEVERISEVRAPPLSQLFAVYKDAPASVNLFDFYSAFKHSLNKESIIDDIKQNLLKCDLPNKKKLLELDIDWDKFTYTVFIQSCFELIMMGILKEKSRADFLEKSIWKGL